MYVLTIKLTNKIICIEEKTSLAHYLNVDTSTIYRRFDKSKVWEDDKHHIIKADEFIRRTPKTGFTHAMREAKGEKDNESW